MTRRWLGMVVTLIAARAAAQGPVPPDPLGWKTSVELGVIDTRGNTRTTTVNGKLRVQHESSNWRNRGQLEYLKASDANATTARRTVGEATTNYKFDDRNYLFGNARYEEDLFAGYDYRASETVGYGRRFRWDTQKLDLEGGVGASQTRFVDGTRERDGILRVALFYACAFSETGEFSENAFSEIGSDNTHSESETALKLRINGNLAMKLSYKFLHNSDVPLGRENSDRITAVTLVYEF